MPVLYNTGDWFTLRPGITFRKFELYTMEWSPDTELEQLRVFAAPYGGPLAMYRDPKQFIKTTTSNLKPVIRIFTSSGTLMASINWSSGNLLTMGWTDGEELLCIQDDGLVLNYDIFGNYQHTFSMGQEVKDTKITDAMVFPSSAGTGLIVMTSNFRLFLVNNIKDPKIRQLPDLPKSVNDPTAWNVITEDRNTCCIISRGKELYKLKQGVSITSPLVVSFDKDYSSIIDISVSYNQKYVALYTNNGLVWIGTSDLKHKYCEFDTNRNERPKQISWCMDPENPNSANAVIVTYPSILLVISIAGDSNLYPYDPAIFLIPEMDGIRILTNSTMEMIQRVPKCVTNIFAINSQEPSSFLFEAHKKYKEESHQSNEYLCLIKHKLHAAVNECVEAAGYEYDPETQKSLIRSAYFGKSFIAEHDPTEYVRMCRILRVLNAVRQPRIGIPLTIKQFHHLTPLVFLDRLVFRKHYGLAVQIAKHLELPESRILEHWAYHKILHDKNDDEVAHKIEQKFKSRPNLGLSFCNIAKKAEEAGRIKLATTLLEMEPKSSLKVPLLLKLQENKKALYSATKSGDTDLVYTVLLQLKETTQLADFQMTIRMYPMAQNLYKKYCQMYSKSALQEIFNQEDDFLSQALFTLREGMENKNMEGSLPIAATAYKKAHKDTEAELCEDYSKLLKQQKSLSEKYNTSSQFYGLPIHDTLKKLLTMGDIKLAEKLKSEYKIPDRRYFWVRIQVLADHYQWEELEKMSKIKKSPIGYEPFVEVCLEKNNLNEARKYLPKCREEKKVNCYLRAGLADEAAICAFEQRDINGLWTIHMHATKNNNAMVIKKVETMIAQLSSKR